MQTLPVDYWQQVYNIAQRHTGENPDCVTGVGCGDYIEFFDHDAERLALGLNMVIQNRAISKGVTVKTCAIPAYNIEKYARLAQQAGFTLSVHYPGISN